MNEQEAGATGQPESAPSEVTKDASEWQSLLLKEIGGDKHKEAVTEAVGHMAQWALRNTALISKSSVNTIKSLIAEIDQKLSGQLSQIMHHEKFQKLEGAWRGLHYLVNNTETDKMLQIHVLHASKEELHTTLSDHKGARFDQSPIFKKVHDARFDIPNAAPFACIVGDYHFDHGPQDVELLGEMAKISAASHAPFITGAAPSLMDMKSWQELQNPPDVEKLFDNAEHIAWNALRRKEDARYVGLAMPRFLARLPYGEKNPVKAFDFEEETAGSDHSKFCWANSAYAMGTNINRSYKFSGWCSNIRGYEAGGAVSGLPIHTFPTDEGGTDYKCPTEISITTTREAALARCGLMPLVHWKDTDTSVFVGAQSLQEPEEYDKPEATANARLSARLSYLFACCRFAHYLKRMVYNKIGKQMEKTEMERWLNDWIQGYVLREVEGAAEEAKASNPLSEAKVVVKENEDNPGSYEATFFLRPHYQVEEVHTTLHLVSKIPDGII